MKRFPAERLIKQPTTSFMGTRASLRTDIVFISYLNLIQMTQFRGFCHCDPFSQSMGKRRERRRRGTIATSSAWNARNAVARKRRKTRLFLLNPLAATAMFRRSINATNFKEHPSFGGARLNYHQLLLDGPEQCTAGLYTAPPVQSANFKQSTRSLQ